MDRNLIEKLVAEKFVLIKLKGKQPVENGWQTRTESIEASDFEQDDNVGLVLGDASGIIDIDIDSLKALALADVFLPPTGCVFGRASKPKSHRLYRVPEAQKTEQFRTSDGMIVELRGNGAQTMIPPSVHPGGEEVAFSSFEPPTGGEWNDLQGSVLELAIASVIEPYWKLGNRHNCCLALVGVLHGSRWPQQRSAKFVHKLVDAFNDEEGADRQACVASTYENERSVSGKRALADLISEGSASSICKWVGWKGEASAGDGFSRPHFTTDADCAEHFARRYQDRLLFSFVENGWFERRNGVYVPITEAEIQSRVVEYGEEVRRSSGEHDARKFLSANGSKSIVTLARSKLGTAEVNFDADADLLGCLNGVLNLTTGELSQDPQSMVTRRVSVAHDPKAECPQFRRFLADIFEGDKEVIDYLQRCMGYTIQGSVVEHCLFVCIGNGRNGKSTLLNALTKLMGEYAGTLSMASLMEGKFDRPNYEDANLKGKRFIACQEGEAGKKLAEARVKLLTGGDKFQVRAIYGRPEEIWPTHKIWLGTNELPTVEGMNDGIWSRMKNIIRFPKRIPESEIDLELPKKLSLELPGILNFAIDGYRSWKEQKLSRPAIVQKEHDLYKSENDTVGAFIISCCVSVGDARASTAELYVQYENFCNTNGHNTLSRPSFGKVMRSKGYIQYRARSGNGWIGIRLAPTVSNDNIDFDIAS